MKFAIVFAAILAVSAAQQPEFDPARIQYVSTIPPPSPVPYRVSTIAPEVINVNRAYSNEQNARIVRYDSDINPDGSYAYAYETENGIAAQEQGTPRDFGGNPPLRPVVAQGSYSYTSPEGKRISVSYIADEFGFHPTIV